MQLEYTSNTVRHFFTSNSPRKFCAWAKHSGESQECARIFGMHTEFSQNFYHALRLSKNALRIFIPTAFRLIPALVWLPLEGYNARQFITEFINKGWTKNSINRLLVKFRTVERRLERQTQCAYWWKCRHSWVAVAESGRQTSEPREISREAGHPSIVSFADYSQSSASQVLQEKTRPTADWTAQHARVIFGVQFERR